MNLLCHILFTLLPLVASGKPVAQQEAVVLSGNARFTVLTPQLIRMEWAEDGVFEDRATLGIVNRELPVPPYKVTKTRKKLTIKTSALTLTYTGQAAFDEGNLQVSFTMLDAKAKKGKRSVTWKPGADDSGNLLGTARTLDQYDGIRRFHNGRLSEDGTGTFTKEPFDKGVVSRDGWAIIDESTRHVFVPVDTDWQYWVDTRPEGNRQDWYLFAYGHDYTAAISDFTKIAGKIPLPPKYAFGYWWCRYWMYSDY